MSCDPTADVTAGIAAMNFDITLTSHYPDPREPESWSCNPQTGIPTLLLLLKLLWEPLFAHTLLFV